MGLSNKVIDWASKADPTEVNKWLLFATEYMKKWGWNDNAIDAWIEWGQFGFNNKLLHFETTIESFYDEVMYCSDRMSIDRLFRCHVKYRTISQP